MAGQFAFADDRRRKRFQHRKFGRHVGRHRDLDSPRLLERGFGRWLATFEIVEAIYATEGLLGHRARIGFAMSLSDCLAALQES